MSNNTLTIEDYDYILDSLDNENISEIQDLFNKFNLSPLSELLDSPRIGYLDNDIYTYVDYALLYNLKTIIDIFIDEFNLVINDEIIAKTLILGNVESYKYLIQLGYIPDSETLKTAVQICYPEIVDDILDSDKDLINIIAENDIESMYSVDIDEETIETVRVLFNYGIKPNLFGTFLFILKEQIVNDDSYSESEPESNIEKHIIYELIDILESNNVN